MDGYIYRQINNIEINKVFYCVIILANVSIQLLLLIQYMLQKESNSPATTHISLEFNQPVLSYVLITTSFSVLIVCGLNKIIAHPPDFMRYAWVYGLFILEALTSLFVSCTAKCFKEGGWCEQHSQIHYKILLGIAAFLLVIGIYLKNKAYFPFYSVTNLLSMRQSYITMVLFFYRLAVGLIRVFPSTFSAEFIDNITILLVMILFWKSKDSGYIQKFAKMLWDGYFIIIVWSQISYFLVRKLFHEGIIGYKYDFQGQQAILPLYFQFWGCTMPILLLTLIFSSSYIRSNSYKELFGHRGHKIEKEEQPTNIFLMCNQVLHLVQSLKKSDLKYRDPSFKSLLYLIEKHWEICCCSDCQLSELENILSKDKQNQPQLENKFFIKFLPCVLEYCRVILKRLHFDYPRNIKISIEMASFQLFALMYKQEGMLLYSEKIEDNSVSDEQKYGIFFLKNKIDEMFIGAKKLGEQNINQIESEFRQKLQISVAKLSDFWYFLSEPKCNLKKLYDLANQLYPLKMGVEHDWQRIKALKSLTCSTLYARYLLKLFNDKNKGLQILEQIKKIEHEQLMKNQIELDDKMNEIIEEDGVIFLEFGGKKSGIIFQNNVNAEKIFGYGKGELLYQKVNDLMPKIFSVNHDRILENYQQTGESRMMNKQRHIWGKSKDGFIFPMLILIKPVLSIYSESSTSEVYASFKRDICMKQIACLVLDKQKNVTEISSSALKIFPSLNYLNNKSKIHISTLIPDFSVFIEKLEDHQICEMKFSREIQTSPENQRIVQEFTMLVNIEEVTIKVAGLIGYMVKLTKIHQSIYHQTNDITQLRKNEGVSLSEICTFQFGLKVSTESFSHLPKQKKRSSLSSSEVIKKDKNIKKYRKTRYPDNSEQKQSRELKTVIFSGTHYNAKEHFSEIEKASIDNFKNYLEVKEECDELQKIEWGNDIRVKRLYNGFIKQMREQSISQFAKKQEENTENSEINSSESIKTSEISQFIEKQKNNPYVAFIKIITFIAMLLCSVSCIIQYFLEVQLRNSLVENMQRVRHINQISCEVLLLKFDTVYFQMYSPQDLILRSDFQIDYLVNDGVREDVGKWYDSFVNNIKSLDTLVSSFIFNQNITVKYRDNSEDNFYSGFALNKLISQANSIKNILDRSSSLLVKTDSSSFFLMYNTVNGLLVGLEGQNQAQVLKFNENIDKVYNSKFLFFLGIAGTLIITLILKNIVYNRAIQKKAKILEIFFEIPRKSCTTLHKECEKFIFRLSNEDEIEQQDFDDDINLESQNSVTKKKRTLVGQQSSTKQFFCLTLIFLLICTSFYLYEFIIIIFEREKITTMSIGAINFYEQEKNFAIFQNFMNSYINDPTFPLMNDEDQDPIITQRYEILSQNIQYIKRYYLSLYEILGDQFLMKTKKMFYEDYCQTTPCQKILDLQSNGLNSIQNSYMLHLQQKYTKLLANQTQDQISQKMLSQQFIFYDTFKKVSREASEYLQSSINSYFAKINQGDLFKIIILCFFFLVVVLAFWFKYYSGLESKIKSTQYILTFIPANQINKNHKISKFIRKNYSVK